MTEQERSVGLRDIILDYFSSVALALPDPIEKKWTLPLTENARQEIASEGVLNKAEREILSYFSGAICAFEDLFHDFNANMAKYGLPPLSDENVLLGAGLIKQDLADLLQNILTNSEILETLTVADAHGSEILQDSAINFANLRAICLSTSYLVSSGNPEYLALIPTRQIEHTLRSKSHTIKYNVQPGIIHSPEYVALWQLVNNATTDMELIVENTTYRDKSYTRLAVMDHGPGLLNKGLKNEEDEPFSSKDIPKLFDKFSSKKGGGLGLRIARRLTELRGGFIQLMTSTGLNGLPLIYDTRSRGVSYSPGNMADGVEFSIYIPTNG